MKLPDDVIERLKELCAKEKLGMAQLVKQDINVNVIIIGPTDMSPDQISVVAAYMLLHGVMMGEFTKGNREVRQQIEEAIEEINKEMPKQDPRKHRLN